MRRCFQLFLLLAGLAGVGIWVWSHVSMFVFEKQANRALERQMARPLPPRPPAPTIENGALLGRLSIPRLKMQAALCQGDTAHVLDVALGHIPGTPMPGQPGNVGIAGHRDTLFRALRDIRKDDLIEIETPARDYTYQVEGTSIVKPRDVAVLHAGAYPELTLVTCYPFYYVGSAPNRFIVKARLISSPPPSPAPPLVVKAQPVSEVKPAHLVKFTPAPKPTIRKVSFEVTAAHPREVAPGILIGLSSTDASGQRANGWLNVAPEHLTIWLHNQAVNQPLVFGRSHDGQPRELMLTSVTPDSMAGYLLQP